MASKRDKYIEDLIKSIRSKSTTEPPEKQAYDPAKQAAGLEARLEGSGVKEDKRDTRNIVEKALNLTPKQNVLFDVFEIINRPQQMLFQGIKAAQEGEDVGKAIRKGFGGVGEEVRFKEILHNAGMEDSEKSFGLDDVLGFTGDVFADPIDLALIVAAPFTGGASGAVLGAKKAIQAADTAADTLKSVDAALTVAKAANNTAEVARLTKKFQQAQKTANKLQESKKLWQNLETAANNLTELKKIAKKTGNTDGLADALTAYKRAVQPLKKRMTPLEFTFKKVKGGVGKTINLADDGITGVLTKIDGVIDNSRIAKVQKAQGIDIKKARKLQDEFNQLRPWATKYADMKAAVNSIFDAAKAIPKGLWNKTKELTGSRKLAVARMSKLQLENVQDIAKVAKDFNLDPDEVSRMLMRNYEYMKHTPDMKFSDLFDATYINNNPMTEQNYQAFKDYIRNTFKDKDGFSKYSEAAIDDLFTVKPIKEGSELKIWLPKQDANNKKFLQEMLDDVNSDFARVTKDTEKFGKRFEKLQEKYNKLQETQAKALEYINKNSNRFATIDGKTVAILTSDELDRLKKLGIDLKPDKNGVVTHDAALKRINARIKNADNSLSKIDDTKDVVKVGKVEMTPDKAKKSLTSLRDKMVKAKDDVTKSKKELSKYINDASGAKLTKQADKMKALQDNLRPIVHENVIPASRYYDDNDVLEMQEFFKSPEMEELYKRFDERYTRMFQDLNDLLGTALDGEGYMRHVLNDEYAQELRNLPKDVQTKLRDSGIIGNTSTFRGRAYQMSAYEANAVRKQITQNMLETGKYSDDVKTTLESLVDLDMFEVDAVSSTWDFIRNAPKEIEKGRRIEETLKASLANGVAGTLLDPEMLKPFETMTKFENGKMVRLVDTSRQTLVSADDLFNKIDELGYTFQNEALMNAIKAELQASKASQLVIDKNLYNLIGFTTDKTINEVAENTVKLIDKTNNMFKKFKLLSPGFQIRNLVGNFTNILLSGVNPYKIMDNNVLAHRVLAQGDALMTKRAKGIALSAGELELLDLFEGFTREGFDQIIGATDLANIASVYDIPEDIAKMMRKGSEKSKNPLKNLMAWNARTNELVDRQFRMSAYIYAQRNPEILARVGVSTPAEFVRKVLFDPNDLSKVEQQYLKRLIPFYTFTKKNLAYQMRNVWDNPNRYNKLLKAIDGSWSMLDIDPKTELEQYKRENMWIPVFVNQNGEYKALKANLPVGDFGEFVSDPMKKIVSSTAPVIRTPFELTMNTQAFTQMPIQEFKGQRGYQLPFVGRKVEYGLSQLGLDVPIAAGYDLAKGAGQVAQGNIGQGLETGVGRSFLSSGSVEKARLSADYQRLNELRDLLKYYKQEGKKILTLDEIANLQQDKSQSIIQRIRAIGRG